MLSRQLAAFTKHLAHTSAYLNRRPLSVHRLPHHSEVFNEVCGQRVWCLSRIGRIIPHFSDCLRSHFAACCTMCGFNAHAVSWCTSLSSATRIGCSAVFNQLFKELSHIKKQNPRTKGELARVFSVLRPIFLLQPFVKLSQVTHLIVVFSFDFRLQNYTKHLMWQNNFSPKFCRNWILT